MYELKKWNEILWICIDFKQGVNYYKSGEHRASSSHGAKVHKLSYLPVFKFRFIFQQNNKNEIWCIDFLP